MFCSKCGQQNDDNATTCVKCGATLKQKAQNIATEQEQPKVTPVQPAEVKQTQTNQASQPAQPTNKTSSSAIGSLITGIIGLFIAGIILGCVGISLALNAFREIKTKQVKGKGMAIAGLIVSIIAFVGAIVVRFMYPTI